MILTLTTFAQARNWRLSYEMYASIHFAAFGLTVFGLRPNYGGLNMKTVQARLRIQTLTSSQHLSKCYQHIFYEF